jgi:tRNA threonylcarbamoyl adenosine modification protein YeaZ
MDNSVSILGIESSGASSGISLSKNGFLIGQISFVIKNIHSRLLAISIDQILSFTNLDLKSISAIALSAGPGSFTGLRIGYSLAKGLAHVSSIPIIEIPTLDIYAYQNGETNLPVLSLLDAHRDEIFCSKYRWKNNYLVQEEKSHLRSVDDLNDVLLEPTEIVGAGVDIYKEKIQKYYGNLAIFSTISVNTPESWALQRLAYQKYLNGEKISADKCQPFYLRSFKGVM